MWYQVCWNLYLVPAPSALSPALREAEGDQLSQRCHRPCAGGIGLAPQAEMSPWSQPRHQVQPHPGAVSSPGTG